MSTIKRSCFLFVFVAVFVFSQSGTWISVAFAYDNIQFNAVELATNGRFNFSENGEVAYPLGIVASGCHVAGYGIKSYTIYRGTYPSTAVSLASGSGWHDWSVFSDIDMTGVAIDSDYWIFFQIGYNSGVCGPTVSVDTLYSLFTRSGGVWTSTFSPATCSDGIQNQDETGVDTGGVCQSSIHNPVIIVPGLLGTEISKPADNGPEKLWLDIARNITNIGDQFMDSLQFNSNLTPSDTSLTIGEVLKNPDNLFNYTEALIQEFQNQGYTEGTDLFLFPYDWRYGVSGVINLATGKTTVDFLKDKIEEIRAQTDSDKVDIIAHSTGGLLIKKYVMDHPTDNYIGKAVFVGVPNTGAPKAIKALIQGDSFGVPFLANEEMKKISKNLPVSYDLSPSEQYFNTKGSYIKIIDNRPFSTASRDLDFEQADSFLINGHQLNNQALLNARNLHTADFDNYDLRTAGVDLYAVDGCKTGTIGKVVEVRHYTLFDSENYSSRYQLEGTPGDGTVPLESATNLPIEGVNKYYALKASHGKMLSQDGIRQQIVNIVSSSDLETKNITQDIVQCKLKGKAISVFSPLDIDIIDQDGNHSGLVAGGIQNDIPNASFEIMGEHKFVYLPDDEGQTYTINVKGTGNGTFTLKDQDINDNQVTQTQIFSNISVTSSLTGQINIGDITTTLSLNNNDQPIQPSSVVNAEQSKDFISPISTSTITGSVGQPSFYRSNVNINISATDPIITGQENQTSGILKTIYKLDNDSSYTTYVNPIIVSSEGLHTPKFFSTDKAGNNETEQSFDFTIDKTAPEFVIQFSPINKDLQFIGIDNLTDSSAINVLDQDDTITLTDQAGNTTQIKLKDKNRKHKLKAEIKSLIYNNQPVDITKNKLAFDWKFDKQQNLKELNQYVKSKKDFNIDAVYKNGKTKITGKDKNGKINKLFDGLILVKISTDKGDLNWSY